MYFSDHFGVQLTGADDWFDPILNADTKVFIDPFLIFAETTGDWASCHAELIDHFDTCYSFVAWHRPTVIKATSQSIAR